MTKFHPDECSSARGLIRSCKKGGLAQVRRYPTKHKSLLDPEMLYIYTKKDGVIVTFDLGMADENAEHIPVEHPGLIMIGHSPEISYTITEKSATKITSNFKDKFPEWHQIPWKNCIVKMTDATVEVGYILEGTITYLLHRSFEENEWQNDFRDCLAGISEKQANLQ